MWFSIYIYILYRTDYIALQKVRKSVNMFCQNTSGCWMKRRFQCLMPGPGSQAKSTSSIVASVYGDKVIVKVPWRPKMRCLRLRSVACMVGQGQQSESLALSRRPTPGPHPQTIKLQSINTCSKRSRCLLVNRKNPISPRTLISGTLLFSLDEVTDTSSCFKIRYSSFLFEPRWLNLKIAHMVKSQ